MSQTIYFINSTNGLEALPFLKNRHGTVAFLRLQSTDGEHGIAENCNKIIQTIDTNFLMHLAIGNKCIFFDYTSRYGGRRPSRAIWQCLEWIKYAVNRCWFDREIECPYGQHVHFKDIYEHVLDKKSKRKLKYFKNFLLTDKLKLKSICHSTTHDSNFEFYKKELENYVK